MQGPLFFFRVGDEIHGNPTRLCRDLFFFFGGSSDQGSLNDRVLGGSNLMQEYGNLCIFEGFTV